jgi:hypothetical protein
MFGGGRATSTTLSIIGAIQANVTQSQQPATARSVFV